MVYKDFKGLKLSALGMGCMRLPLLEGQDDAVDTAAVNAMVDLAIAEGVNYFDTAWAYHGGKSEAAIGGALARHPRESFFLADKFPGYDHGNFSKIEEIFEEQLRRCGLEYFDFYLFHNVSEKNVDDFLDEKFGLMDYLQAQKAKGRIRHLGFSTHGSLDTMRRFLEAYAGQLEFCQIQLNYIDWKLQNAQAKVELIRSFGLPVWVMEPLRGGRLVALDEAEAGALKALRPEESIPAWAFRFLQSIPEVTMVLSGMSNIGQLAENIETFAADKPLDAGERAALLRLADGMIGSTGALCTVCRYCVDHCPQGLDIPQLVALYNEARFSGATRAPAILGSYPEDKRPAACRACRSCEAVCPQQIKISELMADLAARK